MRARKRPRRGQPVRAKSMRGWYHNSNTILVDDFADRIFGWSEVGTDSKAALLIAMLKQGFMRTG